MKVHTIEIAAAIEAELKKFLSEWGGGYPMRFTRFVDLGGKQTDLYVYTAQKDAPPWMIVRIKSVFKTEEGECMQCFVNVDGEKNMEDVMVSPEVWKLPALADRILNFARNDMLTKISEGGAAIEGGDAALQSPGPESSGGEAEEDEDDLEDIDTSGILADDDAAGGMDFNPEDVIASANEGNEDDADPGELIRQMNEEGEDGEEEDGGDDDEGGSGFNPEDVIKD